MAIRSFAVHPVYRHTEAAVKAAKLLKSKFLRQDNWSWYKHPDNWVRFQFPYWWNHLLSALDACSHIGLPRGDPDIARALQWFIDHQQGDGLWNVSYSKIHRCNSGEKVRETRLWITLSVCRVLRRYFG